MTGASAKQATAASGAARPTAFVIFATQRTGSNWLMGMLDAHPGVAAYDELFLAGEAGSGYWGRTDLEYFEPFYAKHRKRGGRLSRAIWSSRYLDRLYDPRRGKQAVGMKLMYGQLWKNPTVWLYLLRRRVRIVHLMRGNLLDVIVSKETAEARSRYHAWQGDVVVTSAVTLDPDMVVPTLKTLEFRVKVARWLLKVLPIRSHEVEYEALVASPALVDEVFTFLDVGGEGRDSSPSRFKKLNTSRKSELIENYTEIERALEDTRYARYLDD